MGIVLYQTLLYITIWLVLVQMLKENRVEKGIQQLYLLSVKSLAVSCDFLTEIMHNNIVMAVHGQGLKGKAIEHFLFQNHKNDNTCFEAMATCKP